MEVEFEIAADGAVRSLLASALSGRKVDLIAAGADDVHPIQAIAASWRETITCIERLQEELEKLEPYVGGDLHRPAPLLGAFRALTYSSTELFDAYHQLLPSRLRYGRQKKEQKLIDGYVATCKRLRDPTALLCNKFKHGSRQLLLTSAVSHRNGVGCLGYMVARYVNGDSLLRDEEVHKEPETSVSLRKKLQEITHSLLRVDYNAAELVRTLSDNSPTTQPPLTLSFPFSKLRSFLELPVSAVSQEVQTFDGLKFSDGRLFLVRKRATAVLDPSRRTTTVLADGVTRTFTFA